jgi:hypothetical protein
LSVVVWLVAVVVVAMMMTVCVCVLVEVAVQAIEEDACIGTVGVQDSRTCETTLVVRGG